MKFKRILSMLLAAIMLSTAVIVAFPTLAFAANSAEKPDSITAANMYAKNEEDFINVLTFAKQLKYNSAEQMLEAEKAAGQLMSATSKNGMYSVYVNVYTGFMYYQNNLTGQVLTSNPYDYRELTNPTTTLVSQIELEYNSISNSSETPITMDSFTGAATNGQIYVSAINGGLRVSYTIGDTTLRYLVPGAMHQDRYMECLVLPLLENYIAEADKLFQKHDAEATSPETATSASQLDYYTGRNANRAFKNLLAYGMNVDNNKSPYRDGKLYQFAASVMGKGTIELDKEKTEFVTSGARDEFNRRFENFSQLLNLDETVHYCRKHAVGEKVKTPNADGEYVCSTCGSVVEACTYAELLFYSDNGKLNVDAIGQYLSLIEYYIVKIFEYSNPMQDVYGAILEFTNSYKASTTGYNVICNISNTNYRVLAQTQEIIEKYCVYNDTPTYSFNDMYRDERECGYVHEFVARPVFRCALEYTFNEDGTLSVNLPANSITFDESTYILYSITPLKYFGASDLFYLDENPERPGTYNRNQKNPLDGYIFYPDGSGTIVSISDFYNGGIVSFKAPVYGIDHAYSDIIAITGDYREQVTMPVYGAVYTESVSPEMQELVGTSKLQNGFFAIIEEGAALAHLNFRFECTTSGFGTIYPVYRPYPSDTYDLSQTLSVSGLGEYTMVAETKYSGSFITKITMLTDERLNSIYGANYNASYSAMAECYRDYLIEDGTIEAFASLGNDLPLYIEVFGSMEILEKILSFPVEVSTALTTFENIRTMYDEFADATRLIREKAEYYRQEAKKTEKDLELKALYEQKAKEYDQLAEQITNITNINFRLTGFANGGMEYTYPSKVKWDKVVGGEDGFLALMNYANSVSAKQGSHLGIYPEFDFIYINNTAMFDGIYPNGISSKLIDNRYAEKQLYNSVTHSYESFLTRLVSPDALAELYVEFNDDYSEFGIKNISVSTLGSDINSNFDDENPINREEASEYISDILASMKKDGYDIMLDKGNAYSLEYASHIIDAYIDSNHLRYSSYAVPFLGMVLHGYVKYTGSALNYSGDPDYDILRSIENGASLYYILCYDNHHHMKEDENLNKYYGVSYENWFTNVVEQYSVINGAIGDLQNYKIVDHKILTVERVIGAEEKELVYTKLVNELISRAEEQIEQDIIAAYEDMNAKGEYGKGVKVEIDVDAIASQAGNLLNLTNNIQIDEKYANEIRASIVKRLELLEESFDEKYAASSDPYKISFNVLEEYTSEYNYLTDSKSTDGKNYVKTDYTVNNYNVVMVTYKNATTGHEVHFVLNYNIHSVIVDLGYGAFILGKYEFKRI